MTFGSYFKGFQLPTEDSLARELLQTVYDMFSDVDFPKLSREDRKFIVHMSIQNTGFLADKLSESCSCNEFAQWLHYHMDNGPESPHYDPDDPYGDNYPLDVVPTWNHVFHCK